MSTLSSKYRRHAMLALLCLPLAAAANGLGCRQVAGIEEPAACDAVSDCPAPAGACLEASCVDGACAYEAVTAGSVAPGDESGDCKKSVCDASGNAAVEDDETDSDDGDPCTIDSCEGGVPQHEPAGEVPCYTGPAATEGEGNCLPGVAQCTDGQMGECVGQVLPADETCDEPGDEDCDGMANEGGIGCDCEAGESQPCYTGDPLSEGIGTCQAGTQMCNANGMGFGECTGEVTPAAVDDCATAADDEDCNGLADCQGRTEWYANTVGPLDQVIDRVVVAPDGSLIIAGTVRDAFTFQTQSGTSGGSNDIFVAKLNADTGAIVWFTRFGATCSETVSGLAVTPAGEAMLIGSYFFPASCVINGVSMTSEGATLPRQFLVRLGTGGNIITTKQLDMHYVYAVAATATNLYIGGRRHNPAVPADINYTTNKYDLNGVSPDASWQTPYGVTAMYAEGTNIWVAGEYTGTIDLPGGFKLTSAGGSDIWVARLSSSSFSVGVAASFGGTANEVAGAIHADANGIYVGGSFWSPMLTLGADTFTNADATADGFVSRLNVNLVPETSMHLTGANTQEVTSISPSGLGLSIGGQYQGVLTLVGFPGDIPSTGGRDGFVARVLPDTLEPVWRRVIGGTASDQAFIAGGAGGETYFVGKFQGPVDIDDTQAGLENPTETDFEGYVMRMAP